VFVTAPQSLKSAQDVRIPASSSPMLKLKSAFRTYIRVALLKDSMSF